MFIFVVLKVISQTKINIMLTGENKNRIKNELTVVAKQWVRLQISIGLTNSQIEAEFKLPETKKYLINLSNQVF